MPEISGRQQTHIEPVQAWSNVTEAPLKGLALAREACSILAWDESGQLYLFDLYGNYRSVSSAPGRIIAGAISDNGTLIVLLGEGSRMWFLGPDLDLITERSAPPDATNLAIDPHGRFIAVGSRLSLVHFFNKHGKQAGQLETQQAMAHLVFVPNLPFLIGASGYGRLVGIGLQPGSTSGKLSAELEWDESLMSSVGRLTTTGDGGMVLASCFTYGIQRFDIRGSNEGSYHLGGTASHAAADFAGRMIAVATLEGELAVLSSSGGVRWKSTLPRPVFALEVDPLGRYLILGHETGEVARLDLYGESAASSTKNPERAAPKGVAKTSSAAIRSPAWSIPVCTSDEQAEFAVLAVMDDPPRIGMITNTNRLQVFSAQGENLGLAPEILGVGRILRTDPGWIAAATDRNVMLYDARRARALRADLSLVELTHLAIRPDSYGIGVIQERDRIGRATLSGRWIWKLEVPSPIEEFAINNEGFTAFTTAEGSLVVMDPGGGRTGTFAGHPSNPLFVVEAPKNAPGGLAWVTLARRDQVLRGHNLVGNPIWQCPVPWEGWQLHQLGAVTLVVSADGRTTAHDGSGRLHAQTRVAGNPLDVHAPAPGGQVQRLSKQGVHLICSDLNGRVTWRALSEQPLGPVAAGASGVAVLMGRSLAWFPTPPA